MIKRTLNILVPVLLLAIWQPVQAQEQPVPELPSPIVTYPLNHEAPYYLSVHPQVGLTVSFPGPIGRPFGPGVSSNIESQDDFYIQVAQGSKSFSIAVLNPLARTRNLNVPYKDKVYTIFLSTVADPNHAIANVTFTDPSDPKNPGYSRAGSITRMEYSDAVKSKATYAAVGEKRLIGFVDRLKMIHSTREDELEEVLSVLQGIDIAILEREFELRKGVRLKLLRVARDNVLDLVGFICILENDTLEDFRVDRDTFRARVGAAAYSPAIAKCPSVIEARSVKSVYFAINGNSRGGPGHLSETNAWELSMGILKIKSDG